MVKPSFPTKNIESVGDRLLDSMFFSVLEKKYSISKDEFLKFAEQKKSLVEKKEGIPVDILRSLKLSSLECIVKFLRENKSLSYVEIGNLISRNPKSLAVTYAVSKHKSPKKFSEIFSSETIFIPFSAFKTHLSVLESICYYLYSKILSYAKISRILGIDPRTVWTVCYRANKKLLQKSSQSDYPINNKNNLKINDE